MTTKTMKSLKQTKSRKWGESQPGGRYPAVEGPGNPSWERRNPGKESGAGKRVAPVKGKVKRTPIVRPTPGKPVVGRPKPVRPTPTRPTSLGGKVLGRPTTKKKSMLGKKRKSILGKKGLDVLKWYK